VDERNPAYSSIEGVLFNKNITVLVKYPADRRHPVSRQGSAYVIPAGVTSIGDSAFSGCNILTSVTIPSSVASIGNNAFFFVPGLTSITVDIQNPVYSSLDGVLFNKDRTALIQYPEGKQERNYTIPAGVTSIGDGAFRASWDSSLTSITIPAGVTSIGDNAFEGCISLTDITIPASVTSIGEDAFLWCSSLTSITIPAGVTSIGDYAFSGCESLTSITVDANNSNYASQDGILYNKTKTSILIIPHEISGSVTIPAGVISIGNSAFSWCRSLTSITIPASVTSIGAHAFLGCTNLRTVTVSRRTTIGNNAFPNNVQIIYSD
jgi:hypothetical protein